MFTPDERFTEAPHLISGPDHGNKPAPATETQVAIREKDRRAIAAGGRRVER
jgi:hypothetical protein